MITPPDIQPIGLSLIYKVPPCSRVEPCRYSRLAVGGLWKQKTPETLISEAYFLAGVEGIEPPNAWTKTMCLTTWRHPSMMNCVMYEELQLRRFWSWTIV